MVIDDRLKNIILKGFLALVLISALLYFYYTKLGSFIFWEKEYKEEIGKSLQASINSMKFRKVSINKDIHELRNAVSNIENNFFRVYWIFPIDFSGRW